MQETVYTSWLIGLIVFNNKKCNKYIEEYILSRIILHEESRD